VTRLPLVIIGGGIVGLATAREILERDPDRPVVVLEKERDLALHQTGRNSGVIHSGIYYPPGSLKAKVCREGIRLLEDFCDRHGVERRRVGKVIVAANQSEFAALDKLRAQGEAHGIAGLQLIGPELLREVEPAVAGLRALHLPGVQIVDYRAVSRALAAEIKARGGCVRTLREVKRISRRAEVTVVETGAEAIEAAHVVNCGGLECDRIARSAGLDPPIRIIPFRGEYYRLSAPLAERVRGLVYPVPDARFPFLGVHLTPMIDGRVSCGPNAVPALAREGYTWRAIRVRDILDMVGYPGFWRMAGRNAATGFYEIRRSLSKRLFLSSVQRFLPDCREDDLQPDVSGVRAQAVDSDGNLVSDFLTVESPGCTHVLNAPSPAATAAFAIAKLIAGVSPKR
jgi:L-2-hydroxyglutarate oxidase LhgO